jgi:hypothetical protein
VSSIPGKMRIAFLGALVVAGLLVPAGSASAQVELNGIWAPFTRCPVDNPAMLASDGASTEPACIENGSPSGSIKLGNSTQTTGATNLQLGATVNTSTGEFTLISPPGGGLVAEPVNVEGGLLGLMCPSDIPLVSAICDGLVGSPLNAVTATVEPAGEPSDFNRAAGLNVGQPIITLPVKVHLENPVLGPNCYIGGNNDPIVLRPENTTQPALDITAGDFDGTPRSGGPLVQLAISATQGDDTFAVPAARGCGLLGVLDAAVNLQQGLPSPSGNNNLVLNDATSHLMGESSAPGDVSGQQFSDAWHSAVLP